MVFTVSERDELRRDLVDAAETDPRVVGAALTGSAAVGREDRWSDIDLALSVDRERAGVVADGALGYADALRALVLQEVVETSAATGGGLRVAGPIAASSGYRRDMRSPRRLQSSTSPASIPAIARTPSHLIS